MIFIIKAEAVPRNEIFYVKTGSIPVCGLIRV